MTWSKSIQFYLVFFSNMQIKAHFLNCIHWKLFKKFLWHNQLYIYNKSLKIIFIPLLPICCKVHEAWKCFQPVFSISNSTIHWNYHYFSKIHSSLCSKWLLVPKHPSVIYFTSGLNSYFILIFNVSFLLQVLSKLVK